MENSNSLTPEKESVRVSNEASLRNSRLTIRAGKGIDLRESMSQPAKKNMGTQKKNKLIVQLLKIKNSIENQQQKGARLTHTGSSPQVVKNIKPHKGQSEVRLPKLMTSSKEKFEKEMDDILDEVTPEERDKSQQLKSDLKVRMRHQSMMVSGLVNESLVSKGVQEEISEEEEITSQDQSLADNSLVPSRKSSLKKVSQKSQKKSSPSLNEVSQIQAVAPSKENMAFYNDYYNKSKKGSPPHQNEQEKPEEEEEDEWEQQEESQEEEKKEEMPDKSQKRGVLKKICCCCCKKDVKVVPESDEYDFEITYSSGESDVECRQEWRVMNEEQKDDRIYNLWKSVNSKLKGAVMILNRFGDLNRRIYLYGKRDLILQQKNFSSYQEQDYTRICCFKFRTQDELTEEIKPLPFVIMPDHKIKSFWNILIALLLMYTATFVPYRTAYIDEAGPILEQIENIIDVLFIMDLLVNFLSAYEDQDKNIEVRIKQIAKSYIKGWFFMDLVASIPFQYIEKSQQSGVQDASSPNVAKLLKLARLPRLYRMLRILRLFKMMRLLRGNRVVKKLMELIKMNSAVMRLLKIAVTVLVLVHLTSCLWFLQVKLVGIGPDSWVVYMNLQDSSNANIYLAATYWAFQTLTTVGYGDIYPQNSIEMLFSLIWMIIGIGYYSFTMGNLTSIINAIDVKAAHLQQKLSTLQDFAKRNKLPEDLVNRIRKFLELNHTEHLYMVDQQQLLNQLPSSLRANVVIHTHGEIIKRIKFFEDKEPDFLWSILPIMKPMKIYKNDVIYKQGDHAEEIFFMLKGKIKLYYDLNRGKGKPNLLPYNMHYEGQYFGDIEIMLHVCRNVRQGTAIADNECQLLIIPKKEMTDLLKRFRNVKLEMKRSAQQKLEENEETIKEILASREKRRKSSSGLNTGKNQHNERDDQTIILEDFKIAEEVSPSQSKKMQQLKILKMIEKGENLDLEGIEKATLDEELLVNKSGQETQVVEENQTLMPKILGNNAKIKIERLSTKLMDKRKSAGSKHTTGELAEKEETADKRKALELSDDESSLSFKSSSSSSCSSFAEEGKDSTTHKRLSGEQLMASFVDNLSMIALNAYEILRYYESVVGEYERVNNHIRSLELHNEQVELKSKILEDKVAALLELL